ncbi:signal peptidase I [Bacillus niameyensis]|uniref:signal peptidase I n=1 Tax=Bacillus niameyensis TaxID=1522308 RepID=UPI0007850E5F|nr:signal peptidase I [Bacillus niameyensis]
MKTIYDDQFKRLNQTISLNESTKKRMYHQIVHSKKKTNSHFLPRVMTALLTLFMFGALYFIITEGTHGSITDPITPETLPTIELPENAFSLEWGSDDMDRGNHDMYTDYHSELVVSKEFQPVNRGDVLYYEFKNENRLGRIIGLPGETVEIKGGQVYIDGKKLDTFYGTATVRGKREDEYFESIKDADHWVNIPSMKEYFKTTMDPVTVEEGTIFVLVDHWWRGFDSRDFGLISVDAVQGKVLGYKK